jgi:glycosyltransferase involved in cell wall biosynthesis
MPQPTVSLVIPVRNEAGNVAPLVAEIKNIFANEHLSWELFIVDDGSTDTSWEEIEAVASDPRITGIRLDAPRGKSAALAAGFRRCQGAAFAMLDGDGQDNPAEIPQMLRRLAGTGDASSIRADLVNGWKTPRLDPWHKTIPSRVFNLLVGWLTGLHLHDHNCGLKVMRPEVARHLRLVDDLHRFIPVMASARGYRVVETPVHHRPRIRGTSKYGVGRFFRGLFDLLRVAAIVRSGGHFQTVGQRGESRSRTRHGVYAILAALVVGGLVGRLGSVTSVDKIALEKRLVADAIAKATAGGLPVDEQAIRQKIEAEKRLMRPFLSANDRSRWLTIRALVERGSFAIDELVAEPGWDTIDAVAHPDATGRLRLYSSKPPLLAVIGAVPYWSLHRLTGWTLGDHPFEMGRMLMVVYGLVPFGLMVLFTTRVIERLGGTDWGRIWSVALITGGTLLTTFVVVLTNHLPAAACTAASLWLLLRIAGDGVRSWRSFTATGLTAALAVVCELPALVWFVVVLGMLAAVDRRRTLWATLPAAMVVAVAFFATNWLSHGDFVPPYGHRGSGQAISVEPPGASWNPANWYDYELPLNNGRTLVGYWRSPRGIDRGEPSPLVYAFHVLVGHHGIFSLTPAWLLVIPGLVLLGRPGATRPPLSVSVHFRRRLATGIAIVSATVIIFYLSRSQIDRNYGGMTAGFRWAFWLAPLWVAAAVPAVDRLASDVWGRRLALALLAVSAITVAYPTWNPWTLPWLHEWLIHAGWIPSL